VTFARHPLRSWVVPLLFAAVAFSAATEADAGGRARTRSQLSRTHRRVFTPQRRSPSTPMRPVSTAGTYIGQHLQTMANKLVMHGISQKRALEVAEHIGLGMPTDAGRSNPNDYLLARNGYVVSYSRDLVGPKWVAWKVTGPNIKANYQRSKNFRSDPTLPKSWPRARNSDYKRSGWTRGHLVASGERSADRRANAKTFVYSNIVPQAEKNNAGPWNHFEHYYRDLASNGHDVFVLAGGVYSPNPQRIGQNQVAVPDATWKVAVVLEKGQTLKDVDQNTRVISIVVPNNNHSVRLDQSFADFRTSPAAIEAMTGNKFFSALPPNVRSVLLSKVDKANVPPPQAGRWHERKVRAQQGRDLMRLRSTQPANDNRPGIANQSSVAN